MSQHFSQSVPFHVREGLCDGIYSEDYQLKEPLQNIDTGDINQDDDAVTDLIESIEAGEQEHHWNNIVKMHERELIEWMHNQTGWAYDGEAYRHGINH